MNWYRGIAILALSSLVQGATVGARGEPLQLYPPTVIASVPPGLGNGYAIPCATDWNGDGRKDLLVGYQTAGKIMLCLNVGSDAQPIFTNFSNLKTGAGADISLPSGGCGAPAPWVCDFDGDGKRDLLVGAGADGTVWLYRNTNTDSAPILAPGVQLRIGTGTNLLVAGSGAATGTGSWRATPYLHDWDEDGLPDLLCGAGDGYVYFFRNTNTAREPVFAPSVKIQAGGVDLFLGIRSVIRVFDWDGDGLKDLVCSSDTGVYWCRNTNSNSNPVLQSPLRFSAPVSGVGLTNICLGPVPGARMRLDLVDWNNDGVMDLLVGNSAGNVYCYQGYHFGIRQTILGGGSTVALQWNSAPYLSYNVFTGCCATVFGNVAVTNLPSQGMVTSWTNRVQSDRQFFLIQIAP